MIRSILAVATAALFMAQVPPPAPTPLTGEEIITVLPILPNGTLGTIPARVTVGQVAAFAAASTISTATTGTIAATQPTTILSLALTGAVTFTLPAAPVDGQAVVIVNGTQAPFTQTITATSAATVLAPMAINLPAGGWARWQYNLATTTWDRTA